MAQAIKFDSTGPADAYLDYDVVSDPSQWFIEIEYYIPAATLSAWDPGEGTAPPALIGLTLLGSKADDIYAYSNTGTSFDDWGDRISSNLGVAPIPATWQTLKLFRDASGGYYQVDATQQTYAHSPQDLATVRVGQPFSAFFIPPVAAVVWVRSIKVGTDDGLSDILDFDATTAPDLSPFTLTGTVTLADLVPPVPPATSRITSPRWRFVVGDLPTFEILSFLDRIATDRLNTYTLNQPASSVGKVPSDNPEVNIPWPTVDDDPFLTEGSRVLWGFRDEGPTDAPWVIRFAGIIMQLSDAAESDNAFSTFTAWDPWKYLFARPVCNADGSLPGPDGISFTATQADVIAGELLANTIANNGITGIDAGLTYGGTADYTGTISPCAAIDINFPQGTSVGQAWQMLTNLDVCDIVLLPIYDPINRPGYLVEFNIAPEWGSIKDDEIFAWDMPSKSLVGINRLIDGTQRADVVKFFAGQGGSAPGGQTIPPATDATAIAKYGEYWRQTFFPGQNVAAAFASLAAAQLELSKDGQTTVTFSPAPERSPSPFTDYFLGDRVPVYASNRFRAPIPNPTVPVDDQAHYQRVYGIPLTISDDATEQVTQMLTALGPGT